VVAERTERLMYRYTPLFDLAWKRDEDDIDPKAMSVARLVRWTRELSGQDETGRIRSASVILKGPLMRAKLVGCWSVSRWP
jgi:hypothetical protein